MGNLPNSTRVVIIGGGAIGASCLYHLAKAGWTNCVLLEKNELTAGSTWHAAGNVPTFSTSWAIMNMQRYSTELYRELGDLVDYPMNYHVTGSIRLAHSTERMQEFERAAGMGRHQGIDMKILELDECRKLYPFLETHDLSGALYDPTDGDIDPSQLTQALAKGARDMGAHIERFCDVTGIQREENEWIIETNQGPIRAEYVVNAAGYYAGRVGEWFKPYGGREVPMMVMSHQYLIFDEVQAVKDWSATAGHKLPLLRDVDSSYYLRQEKYGFNLGPYERNCRAHWVHGDDPMPDDFSFQLYPDDLDRLEWYIEDAMARVPLLAEAGMSKVINGPIPYAPDGLPLLGPMPGVPNAFEACVFTFGIAQAGGAGKVLAEWVTKGSPDWDMWAVDPRRFTGYADQEYTIAKGMEVYGHEYAMHFPHHRWPAGKDQQKSALHERLLSQGAQMGAYNGWERANWFAQAGDDLSEASTQSWARKGPWAERIGQECEAVRDHCGMLAITGFSRFRVTGDGVKEWLNQLTCSRLPNKGRVGLLYFADAQGRIVTEMSATELGENTWLLITAGAAQWHDYEWLAKHAGSAIHIADISADFECLLVTGPKARDILEPMVEGHDLTAPWLSVSQNGTVHDQDCMMMRVSFAGELGWEIHVPPESVGVIWDGLLDAGVKPFGMWALNSLRIEKAYRAWKGDLSTDYTILQAGLGRFVDWDKPEFLGRDAMLVEKQTGLTKRFAVLKIDCEEFNAPYMSTIWMDHQVVGEITSADWGFRVQGQLALAMLHPDFTTLETKLEVEIYGKRYEAIVLGQNAIWDTKNERLRA